MKTLTAFWNKDLINKLIALVSVGLVLGVLSLTILLLRMPAEKSLRGAVSELIPGFDHGSGAIPPMPTATASTRAAWTPRPTRTPSVSPPGASLETPPPDGTISIETPLSAETAAPSREPTPGSSNAAGIVCIPSTPAQTGRVVEILDGNTVKVLIDDKVYVVRYLGVIAPDAENPFFAAAMSKNSELVYGRDITLTADTVDKDPSGRWLRYVTVGETFVNLELLRQGLAAADSGLLDLACAGVFAEAQQVAVKDRAGQWSLPPTNPSP